MRGAWRQNRLEIGELTCFGDFGQHLTVGPASQSLCRICDGPGSCCTSRPYKWGHDRVDYKIPSPGVSHWRMRSNPEDLYARECGAQQTPKGAHERRTSIE
jgi:hypothetical protein